MLAELPPILVGPPGAISPGLVKDFVLKFAAAGLNLARPEVVELERTVEAVKVLLGELCRFLFVCFIHMSITSFSCVMFANT